VKAAERIEDGVFGHELEIDDLGVQIAHPPPLGVTSPSKVGL